MTPSARGTARRAGAAALALGLALLAVVAARAAAEPAESAWARSDEARVRLVSAVTGTGEAGSFRAGLQFELQPGWKTYWRSPGDAGLPVTVDWTGSENLAGADMAWPAPHRFSLFGLDTFGYEREVVFPLAITAERPAAPVRLKAHVSYLVCKEICIPHTADLDLSVPGGPATPSPHMQLIDRYLSQVPGDGAAHGLGLDSVAIGGAAAAPVLEVVARSALPFQRPDLIVEGPPGLHFATPQVALDEGGRRATLRLAVTRDDGAPALDGAALTLTLVDGTRGLERHIVAGRGPGGAAMPPSAAAAAPPAPGRGGLAAALGAALLGGLVLNLMPCVLPVLSLKLLGVLGLGGAARAVVRRSFLATAAGILTAFLALGGVLAVLKAGGAAVGWGIQFQQPVFLVAMAFVLVLFACNLWGWFEVPLPRWASAVAAGGGAGDRRHGSLAGAFMTGLLATLLATPCSAPFLGTAVGFALSQGTGEILSIFAALGLGLALPYLGVAALPRLATALPRPGRWMLVLRRVLGVGLLGTAVWLLSVLSAEAAPAAAAVVAALLAAAALALALRPRLPQGARLATPAVVALLAAAALVVPGRLGEPAATGGGAARADAAGAHWRPWDPAAIPGLVAQGNVVFVDVTADWCVTCQVNRRLVLEDGAVAARLGGPGVVAMLADWTRPSEAIAGYLASFGRYGIPFNVVYGPGAPRGIVLPELLSTAAVFDALDRAATARASAAAD